MSFHAKWVGGQFMSCDWICDRFGFPCNGFSVQFSSIGKSRENETVENWSIRFFLSFSVIFRVQFNSNRLENSVKMKRYKKATRNLYEWIIDQKISWKYKGSKGVVFLVLWTQSRKFSLRSNYLKAHKQENTLRYQIIKAYRQETLAR